MYKVSWLEIFSRFTRNQAEAEFIYFCIFYSNFDYQVKSKLTFQFSRGQRVPGLGKEYIYDILTEPCKCNLENSHKIIRTLIG